MSEKTVIDKEITFGDGEFIVSKTDLSGRIAYGNELFIRISGYTEPELLGKAHSILRHPDMPRTIFKLLWETVQSKREIFAYVKNRTKEGAYYWVLAQVTPSFDDAGSVIGYHSVRRKPSREAVTKVSALYRKMLDAERGGGMEASKKILMQEIEKTGGTYESYILAL